MDGSILGYSEDTGEGAIRTENGDRFTFTKSDWKGERPPKAGDKVDFVGTDGKAMEIYLLKGSFNAPDLSGIGDKFGTAESRAEMLDAVKSNATVGLFLTKPHVAGAGLSILGWLLAGHLLLITDVGDAFDAMGIEYAEPAGSFVFFKTGMPIQMFQEAMEGENIMVGRPFPPMFDWCRVSIGTQEEMLAFIEATKKILKKEGA